MILKLPLSKCRLLKKDKITLNEVMENNIFCICSDSVDQYIVDDEGKLFGIISSIDIDRNRDAIKSGKLSVGGLINTNPVVIFKNRYESKVAETIFSNSVNVYSVPVVNNEGVLQYLYIRVDAVLQTFVGQNFCNDANHYQEIIIKKIHFFENRFPEAQIKVLSDFEAYGVDLGRIKNCFIEEGQLDMIEPDRVVILLAYLYDFNCMKIMGQLIEKNIKFIGLNFTGRCVTDYYRIDESAKETLEEEAYYNANYFDPYDFQNIFQAIHMTEKLNGCYVEIGTYRGDSARVALSYMQKSSIRKKAYFLDTYEGFTYAEAGKSSDCIWGNTHDDTSFDFVKTRLQEFSNYQLIKANIITDELPEEIKDIAVCNIDVDMYEAVAAALEKVYKRVLPGGVIIAEDFGHTPDLFGAQYAVSRFMALHKDEFYGMYLQSGQYYMIKK